MQLTRVEIRNLRNLSSVSTAPSPGLNILEGANASGKTSFLEAIHLLGLARSFRTIKSEHLIQHEQESLTLFATLETPALHRIGIQRYRDNRLDIHLDGVKAEGRTALANLLPLQLMTPESITLLTGSPNERRQYLDWLLFHVEHSFHSAWSNYQRHLKQRNALLRSEQLSTLAYWTAGVAEAGEIINQMRQNLLRELLPHIEHYVALLLPDIAVNLVYRQGWKKDLSLIEAMERALDSDTKMKYTTAGPHRADLVFKADDDKVVDVFSRGQLKLLLAVLKLAQMAYFCQKTGSTAVVLIDDLPAELDTHHRNLLLSQLQELGTQVFITTTDSALLEYSAWSDTKVFHVEHGVIKEVL
jgi:DNA replication and repair protein RecF